MSKDRFKLGDKVYYVECTTLPKTEVTCTTCNGAKKVGGVLRNKLVSTKYTKCPHCYGIGSHTRYPSAWKAKYLGTVTACEYVTTKTKRGTKEKLEDIQVKEHWYYVGNDQLFTTLEEAKKAAEKRNNK